MRSIILSKFLPAISAMTYLSTGGQIAAADRPTFDVVSIKRTSPEGRNHLTFDKCPGGGRFVSAGTPLMWVIQFAFQTPDSKIFGGPAWLTSFEDAYDIQGKAESSVTESQCRVMVRSLLVDRFRIAVHKETREARAYELVVAKKGSKLREVANDDAGAGIRINGALQRSLSESKAPSGWTMPRMADYLSSQQAVGRVVVDKTGLPGTYQFNLEFARLEGEDRPSIFSALQEQLGLKLEPAKTPVEVLVIDHIEHASEN